MQHLNSLNKIKLKESWISIGSFDGVHRGHQYLIQQMVAEAHALNIPAVVITFFPHPVVVLRGLQGPFYITSPEERAQLLGSLGVDIVITLEFTPKLAEMTAEEFMKMLSNRLGIKQLWVGADFALGKGRLGTPAALAELGQALDYSVKIISPLANSNREEKISSSRIRQYLSEGNVAGIAQLLGRWYSLEAPIIHGDGRGHQLGIPTANLALAPERLIPRAGVYACWATLQGERIPAVTNVGVRPTFEAQPLPPRVEAHLIDYRQDIYGKEIKLDFIDFLRPEMRFQSINSLLEQIQNDIKNALEVLPHASETPGLST